MSNLPSLHNGIKSINERKIRIVEPHGRDEYRLPSFLLLYAALTPVFDHDSSSSSISLVSLAYKLVLEPDLSLALRW